MLNMVLDDKDRDIVHEEYKIRLKHAMDNNLQYPSLNEVALDLFGKTYWESDDLYTPDYSAGDPDDVNDSDDDIELNS